MVTLLMLVVASAVSARRALAPWSDSIALWTRVVALDPRHDVGLYNLATRARGRRPARRGGGSLSRGARAAAWRTHLATANLDRLEAARLEGEGNDLAARGELAAAAERYQQAIAS